MGQKLPIAAPLGYWLEHSEAGTIGEWESVWAQMRAGSPSLGLVRLLDPICRALAAGPEHNVAWATYQEEENLVLGG